MPDTPNYIEWSKNESGHVVGTLRSEHTRDESAVLANPREDILTIADLAGLNVVVSGSVSN